MEHLDTGTDLIRFLRSDKPGAALFYADWCPFSIIMRNSFDVVADTLTQITFAKARLDVLPPHELLFEITSVPTLLFVHRGTILDTFVGVLSPDDLSLRLAAFGRMVESPSGRSRPIVSAVDPASEQFIAVVTVPERLERHGASAKVSLVNVSTGDRSSVFKLDRALTHILLFLNYSRNAGMQSGLFREGRITDRGLMIAKEFKRDFGMQGAKVQGIETSLSSEDPKYLSKQMSRLNRVFRCHIDADVVSHDNGDYALIAELTIRVGQQ